LPARRMLPGNAFLHGNQKNYEEVYR
jgi:hypothetical protein